MHGSGLDDEDAQRVQSRQRAFGLANDKKKGLLPFEDSSQPCYEELQSPPWTQVSFKVSLPAQEGLANLLFELGAGDLSLQEDGLLWRCLTPYFLSGPQLSRKLQAIAHYLSSLAELGIHPGMREILFSVRDLDLKREWAGVGIREKGRK